MAEIDSFVNNILIIDNNKKTMMNPKFQIYKGQDKLYYYTLLDADGQIIFSSKGFYNRKDARESIDELKRAIFNARAEDIADNVFAAGCA